MPEPGLVRRGRLGDGVERWSVHRTASDTAHISVDPPDVEVVALAPHDRVVDRAEPLCGLHWLGFTPAGEVRVATLRPWDPWGRQSGPAILRRASDAGPRRFALPGLEGPLDAAEVRAATRWSDQFVVRVDAAEGWTAQELFDLCAHPTCFVTVPDGGCDRRDLGVFDDG